MRTLPLLVASVVLAGCSGTPATSSSTNPTSSTAPGASPAPATGGDGLTITAESGSTVKTERFIPVTKSAMTIVPPNVSVRLAETTSPPRISDITFYSKPAGTTSYSVIKLGDPAARGVGKADLQLNEAGAASWYSIGGGTIAVSVSGGTLTLKFEGVAMSASPFGKPQNTATGNFKLDGTVTVPNSGL